ncbi:MAG: single-stranded-DNA-specific exonuclease RecJ [Elainellaceae cyanobacterium]
MPELPSEWQIQPTLSLPDPFLKAVEQYAPSIPGHYAAQLLWQRGIRDPNQVAGFIDPTFYQPTTPFEFGDEMNWAVERLQQAYAESERVAIWGDFDADGITATAVLWDGLGQFFPQNERLTYFIPNRLTESHGLSHSGIQALAEWGCQLIVTCDTGSTNRSEVDYAHSYGIDVIITDHHTLPTERPPVIAIVNPRYLPAHHPLANLSGVAVAYKLIEALYLKCPDIPKQPLDRLLDLVAIGLIADLVELTGDCRYLAQQGIQQLQKHLKDSKPSRPGVATLLQLCRKSGDRPTDISFGLGPRINAISRIHGDAHFCVELLTSQDEARCRLLAEETELANTRRKSLQKDVVYQVKNRLADLDLSTTSVIVLADPQWSVGILGLVAGQIAQDYGRPTILLTTALSSDGLARGSARSVNQIDLYQLVSSQAHLLRSFGGHPFAAGLSLPIENLPLFTQAINRQLSAQCSLVAQPTGLLKADLRVTVSELGKDLFQELKLIEPCGIGNPVPRLLIQNCWFKNVWNRNIQDWKGHKIRYIRTTFEIWDDTSHQGFPGVWWEHYKDDIPTGRCDAIAELDYNTYSKRYEIRLVALREHESTASISLSISADWIIDCRNSPSNPTSELAPQPEILEVVHCPSTWDDLQPWFNQAAAEHKKLAIAYPPPTLDSPTHIWKTLVGIAKYLSRTGKSTTLAHLETRLDVSDRTLHIGLNALYAIGFIAVFSSNDQKTISITAGESRYKDSGDAPMIEPMVEKFMSAVREENFRKSYFYTVPVEIIRDVANQSVLMRSVS